MPNRLLDSFARRHRRKSSENETNNELESTEEQTTSNDRLTGIKTSDVGSLAVKRLMKEYQNCHNISQMPDAPFTVELVENSLAEWIVQLFHFDPESKFAEDMKRYSIPYVLLNIRFPKEFPFEPPFMRVVRPHITKGYVLTGGAICMELLTADGWSSVYTVEAVIIQFASQLVKGHGRILSAMSTSYTAKAAKAAFKRLSNLHEENGWMKQPKHEG